MQMKKFLRFFGVFFVLLTLFTNCLKDDDNRKSVYYFHDEPVVVVQTGDYPTVRNESYLFYVPELAGDTALKAGDLLWTSFIVDLDSQAATDLITSYQYTANDFKYGIVDSSKVIIPADTPEFQSYLSDDYTASIDLSVLYKYVIDNLWFFGFKQQDQSDQLSYTYELILNPVIENNYPTLYIRSKQVNASPEKLGKARSNDGIIFAFDATDFVDYYRKAISSTGFVRFNLKYKTGVDNNGNDIYKAFMSNPLSWDFDIQRPY